MSLRSTLISRRRIAGPAIATPMIALLILAGPYDASASSEATNPAAPLISGIEISGNDRTEDGVILNTLGLRVGDVFPEGRFDDIWDAVDNLGFFTFVDMDYEEDEAGGIILTIEVEEEKTSRLEPIIRYDRRFKYDLGASMREINLRGKAEKLTLAGTWHRTHSYRLAWAHPWTFGIDGLDIAMDRDWQYAPFVYRPTRFTSSSAGGSVRYRLFGPLFIEGSLHYETFEQHDDFVSATPDRGDGPGPPTLHVAGRREELLWGGTLGLDSRDSAFYPATGFYHRLTIHLHDPRSLESSTIWTADLRAYVSTPWDHVLALRGWGRSVSREQPLDNRLYLGGEESIRGYSYASLEGEEGWMLGAEYRWPLFLMPVSPRGHMIGLGLHCFGDAGDAWYQGADSGRRLLSWGVGLSLNVFSLQLHFEAARTEEGDTVFQFHDHFNF